VLPEWIEEQKPGHTSDCRPQGPKQLSEDAINIPNA